MISFQDFLNEVYIPGENFDDGELSKEEAKRLAAKSNLRNHKIGNTEVIATDHGGARAFQRHPEKDASHWHDFSKRVINFMKSYGGPIKDREMLLYSKGLGHGAVLNVHNSDGRKQIRYITVLPTGAQLAKNGTQKLMIESVEYNLEILEIE